MAWKDSPSGRSPAAARISATTSAPIPPVRTHLDGRDDLHGLPVVGLHRAEHLIGDDVVDLFQARRVGGHGEAVGVGDAAGTFVDQHDGHVVAVAEGFGEFVGLGGFGAVRQPVDAVVLLRAAEAAREGTQRDQREDPHDEHDPLAAPAGQGAGRAAERMGHVGIGWCGHRLAPSC
ncbi:hypothetical protein ACTD5D_10800 [Nocardia takedensis]|uniref:hypothetical protein n=1 Tax=Nocardia takedensis TaxID=259390 RepID=UPI003F76A3F2